MRELLLPIDITHGRRAGIERALRDAIRSGRLPAGTRLPSTRSLAADCGVARATVVTAYEQLVVEGYLVAQQGAGTHVADLQLSQTAPVERPDEPQIPLADFRPGEPDPSLFPRSRWSQAVRRVLTEASDGVLGYADPRGVFDLRASLAEYLGRARAVSTDPDGVSIFGGVTASYGFLGEMFLARGIQRVAVEDPSLFVLRDVLKLVGVTLVPVPLDAQGIDLDVLATLDVGAAIVTPGHQFPLGITMSPERRAQLVQWARDTDSWIVEDDYDGEFRYDRRPIGSVQGLDPERVIYAGTASKVLSPALRLSWLVVPHALRSALAQSKHLRGGVSTIEQLALSDFITRGDLDRHLRAARAVYVKRQQELADMLQPHSPWLTVSPSKAGLHLAATIVAPSISESTIVARARQNGVWLLGFGPLWLGEPTIEGFVLGYSRPSGHQFAGDLDRLAQFLRDVAP